MSQIELTAPCQERLDAIQEVQKLQYTKKWQDRSYRQRSPALDAWEDIRGELDRLRLPDDAERTIIDVACGLGAVAEKLFEDGWQVTSQDICENCFSTKCVEYAHRRIVCPVTEIGEVHDAVLCSDFLEHVPIETMKPTLDAISKIGRYGAVIGISCLEDQQGLHVTVNNDCDWWGALLSEFWGNVVLCPHRVALANQNPGNWFLFRCHR